MKKKILRLLQLLFLFSCFSLVLLSGIKAQASTNGHSQADAVAWIQARENEGWANDYDGLYGAQCVDLIKYYDAYLGVNLGTGNAYAYCNKQLPSGWTYQSRPQPGDIAVWDKNKGIAKSDGHVALVKSVSGDTFYNVGVDGITHKPLKGNISISDPTIFIHPDFGNSPKMYFDSVSSNSTGKITIKGWAFDADDYNSALSIHVYAYLNGNYDTAYFVGATTANTSRPDVNNVYGCGNNHGFETTFCSPVSGNIEVNVAAINVGSGENVWAGAKSVYVSPDSTNPKISNVKVTNISNSGYTVSCKVSDNVGVKKVEFPTWSVANGQDDLIWHAGTIKDGVATCTIKTSDHGNQTNQNYITHIYVYDYAGNKVSVGQNDYSCLTVNVHDIPKTVNYKVAHYQENLDGTYKRVALETLTAAPGKKVSPAVKSYSGFTSPSKKSATVKEDGSTVIKYYYTRNSYKLTWDLGGGKASGSYTKGTVDFGAKITAPSSVKKSGYVFKGWSVSVPKTMPAKNLTIKAKWEASNQKEVQAFVTRFYKVFLNRKPEKEGLDYWTENLISKKMTGADVARGFVMSKEMSNRNLSNEEFVTLMYKGFFDRVPDTSGYSYWVGKLNSGYSKEMVVAGFVNSQEFKNLCNKYNINPGKL